MELSYAIMKPSSIHIDMLVFNWNYMNKAIQLGFGALLIISSVHNQSLIWRLGSVYAFI